MYIGACRPMVKFVDVLSMVIAQIEERGIGNGSGSRDAFTLTIH